MDDRLIKNENLETLESLSYQQNSHKWMQIGGALSLDRNTQILASGLKVLIDQNNVIIRQNELLLREIKRNNQSSTKKQ